MIVLEDEHGEVTHDAYLADFFIRDNRGGRTVCGIAFRLVERYDSCIELMTITNLRPPTCLWCVSRMLR